MQLGMRTIAFLLSGALVLGCAAWRKYKQKDAPPAPVGVETGVSHIVKYETLAVTIPVQRVADTLRIRDAVLVTRYDTINDRIQVKYVAPSVVERRDTIRQVVTIQTPVSPSTPAKRTHLLLLPAIIGFAVGIGVYILVALVGKRLF